MENRTITEKESMALISEMIKNTQERMKNNSGRPFLIWGYTTVVISILVWYMLKSTGNNNWHFLWFALPVIGWILMLITERRSQQNNNGYVKTYIDKVINKIWTVFGIAGLFICIPPFLGLHFPILFSVVLLMGMGTALTGLVIKFKPCIFGGFISMALSYLFLIIHGLDSCIIFASVFIPMMIIPGHILNYKSSNKNSNNK